MIVFQDTFSKVLVKGIDPDIAQAIVAWGDYLKAHSWQELMRGLSPQETVNGLVYTTPNFLQRTGESFALIDMRTIPFTEPHYHSARVVEIYFFLQGSGLVVVGGNEQHACAGAVVVTPPLTAHYVIPDDECIMAVVNVPPFDKDHYRVVTDTKSAVGFNKNQFMRHAGLKNL